ncbi:rta1 domain-containing, partial [Fusarium albosuccineum]
MSDFEFYRYTPSVPAPAVIAGLFGLSTCLHLYQCVRTRTKHMIPLLVGALCEAVGFAARAISAQEAPDYTLGPYIIQSLLVLVAPVIIAASIYMIFGRIIIVTDGGSRSLIRERLLTRIFVTGDVIAFMVQSTRA